MFVASVIGGGEGCLFTYKKGLLSSENNRTISCCLGEVHFWNAQMMSYWRRHEMCKRGLFFSLLHRQPFLCQNFLNLSFLSQLPFWSCPRIRGMAGESSGLPGLCVARKTRSSVGSWCCIAAFMDRRFHMCGSDFQFSVDPEVFIWGDGRSKHLDRTRSSCPRKVVHVAHLHLGDNVE